MWMMKTDTVTSWKVGSDNVQPLMILSTEKEGVIALKLTPLLARELAGALMSAVFAWERWVARLQ